jgi:hypothetical protein
LVRCWSFLLRRLQLDRWPAPRADIRAGRQTILSPQWAELFGLDYTPGRWHGFRIYDFQINPERRQVTFHGDYASSSDALASNLFRTTFWFSKTCFFVRIKSEEWDPVHWSYYTETERCFEQPDTDNWSFMRWDNQFHSPAFHQPLFHRFH